MSSEVETEALLEAARRELRRPRESVVAALAALGIPAGARVVDAGCGTGVHLPLLLDAAAEGGRVVGVDTDPDALRVARALLRGRDEIELVQGTIEDLPFGNGSFDVVWSSAALHHVEPLERAVAGAGAGRRARRPGRRARG